MLNWKKWCRLCGSLENNQEIEPDIEGIVLQFFEVQSEGNQICQDCDAYVRDFQSFFLKTQTINEMFEEFNRLEENLKIENGIIDEDLVLQVRSNFDLPMPDIEVVDPVELKNNETAEDIATIENFKLDEDSALVAKTEFIIENDEMEFEQLEDEDFTEDPSDSQQIAHEYLLEKRGKQEIVAFDDGIEYLLEDDVDVLTEEEIEVDEQPQEHEVFASDETDDISQHFEFQCHICENKFNKMCFLAIHTKTVHDCSPKVACSCGKFLGTVKAVISHYESHYKSGNYQCTQCNKFYKTESHYQNHMQTHHGESDDGAGRKYRCDCGKSFKEARHLAVHANTHLPDEQKFVHTCSFCQKNYSSIFSLRHHIKHVHEKVPSFQCLHCSKVFSRKANLDSHINHVHTTARNFECEICGLKMKTKGTLRVHKKIHSTNPEDLHTCEVCQSTFKTRNQLTNHMISHSTVKRHKCPQCPAEYKRSKELTCHIASVHTGEIKYACQWCSKTFFNNSNYRKHKLKSHAALMEMDDDLSVNA